MSETTNIQAVEAAEETKKPYELRKLKSDDVFPMFKIISKIGIKEFKDCFQSDDVKAAIASAMNGEGHVNVQAIGITVMLDIAGVVISHISDAEKEIYQFLSGISGMSEEELRNLDMVTFVEMIVDVFKKDEFKDFIGVVSKLFN